jgi:HEAT repeat protein
VSRLEDSSEQKIGRKEINNYLNDLKNGDTQSRALAAYMLGIIGKKNKKVEKALKKALNDQDWEVRKWAALSLGEIGERNSKLVPILIKVLKNEDSKEFRTHAAIILGELEKRAASAIPVLHDSLQDDNQRVREWASWALNRIAGEKPRYRVSYPLERPKLSDKIRFAPKETKEQA